LIPRLLPLLALLPGAAWGTDEFLGLLRKAEGRGEAEERIEYYTRAIRAWQSSHGAALLANCHFRRGEARSRLGGLSEALPDLAKAMDLDPRNAGAHFLRGRILLRLGRPQEAARDLAEHSALRPEEPEGFLELGKASLRADRPQAALRAFERARELAPSDFRAALGEARVWVARRRWERALRSLEMAQELARGGSPEVYGERALCELARGQNQKALAAFSQALALGEERLQDLRRSNAHPLEVGQAQEDLARDYFGRGRLHEFLLRLPEAANDYQQACRLGRLAACARAEGLSSQQPQKEETRREKPAPERRKPKRHLPRPRSEPGERIYAP